uniref:Uncharacterized protein n=1 Tax=Anguilla anguilla TaxID=7936 RepID=A0A0E9PPW7_ANGAN
MNCMLNDPLLIQKVSPTDLPFCLPLHQPVHLSVK